jgi:hypothetical protein
MPRPANASDLRRQASWQGDRLIFRRKAVAEVVRDKTYPTMWRVKLPDGSLSDMVNRTRAKDAAMSIVATAFRAQ